MKIQRINNFDLIRLLAASQVLLIHGIEHFDMQGLNYIAHILGYFPGVPIFFIVSGYLISKSWELTPNYKDFFRNRVLRIYPALWVCLLATVMIIYFLDIRAGSAQDFIFWFFAQASFFQFYNPDFLREFGLGAINGSLWTISVELQFYIFLPLVALVLKKTYHWILFFFLTVFVSLWINSHVGKNSIIDKLVYVSLAPWIFYFLLG